MILREREKKGKDAKTNNEMKKNASSYVSYDHMIRYVVVAVVVVVT